MDAAIWFVGDSYLLDVEGAVNAGWNAVWMNRRKRQTPGNVVNPGKENGSSAASVETEEELFDFFKKLL